MQQKNRIKTLLTLAKKIRPEVPLLKKKEIDFVAKDLAVCFPHDFIEINTHCRYDYYGNFELCSFYHDVLGSGVVIMTSEHRKFYKMKNRFIVLSDMGDGFSGEP